MNSIAPKRAWCKSALTRNNQGSSDDVNESCSDGSMGPALIGAHRMIGVSRAMCDLTSYVHRLASSDTNVLITGETGTGKELIAELIHHNSVRRAKPFTCINCAAIPDGLLESELFGYERGAFTGAVARTQGKLEAANAGTVFFDEIGEMSPYAQAKILRVIERRELHRLGGGSAVKLNLRIIAATNRDLDQQSHEEKFRRDLYYRLNVARVRLVPLRERKPDIPLLIDYYIREFNLQFGMEIKGMADDLLLDFLRYDWPGNIRELKNILESAFVSLPRRPGKVLELQSQLRQVITGGSSGPPSEQDRLIQALWATDWNKAKAARRLGCSRMTLYRKLLKYGIVEKEHAERIPPQKAPLGDACNQATQRATHA